MKINIKYFYLKVWSCVTYCVTLIHQTKTNAMNGINSHTHDYIAIGGYKEEEITLKSCELCAERFWTDNLNPFQGYDRVCETCIALTKQEDSENALYERGVTDGRIELAQQILDQATNTMTKADLIKLISRLQA